MQRFVETLPSDCAEAVEDYKLCFGPQRNTKIIEWKEYSFPPTFLPEALDWVYEKWEPRTSDILAISGYKTGTTWLREIMRQVLYGRDEEMLRETEPVDFYLTYIESGKPSKLKMWDHISIPRRYMQSHLSPAILDVDKLNNCQVIYCTRNPKDQLVSNYHFMKGIPYNMKGELEEIYSHDWNKYFSQHIEGKQPIGMKMGATFIDYNLQWEPYLKRKNFLTVTYEDLIENLPREIRRIAEHLEVHLNEEDVTNIAGRCTMKEMKKTVHPLLLRKGIVGDWKNYFTVRQSEIFDKLIQQRCEEMKSCS